MRIRLTLPWRNDDKALGSDSQGDHEQVCCDIAGARGIHVLDEASCFCDASSLQSELSPSHGHSMDLHSIDLGVSQTSNWCTPGTTTTLMYSALAVDHPTDSGSADAKGCLMPRRGAHE